MTDRNTPYEPVLGAEMRRRLEEQFGKAVMCSKDCELLAADIEKGTGEHIGVTTVKRWFGYTKDGTPNLHGSTRNIIARFLGFPSMKKMEQSLGEGFENSAYESVGQVDVSTFEPGTMVHLKWDPGRDVEMEYLGDFRFRVTKSEKSKLCVDDEVKITSLCKGMSLIVLEIIRCDVNIGAYKGALMGGLTLIEIS